MLKSRLFVALVGAVVFALLLSSALSTPAYAQCVGGGDQWHPRGCAVDPPSPPTCDRACWQNHRDQLDMARQARREAQEQAERAYNETWQNAGSAYEAGNYALALQYYQAAETQRPGPAVKANIAFVKGMMAWYSDQRAALAYFQERRRYLDQYRGADVQKLKAGTDRAIATLQNFLATQKQAAADTAQRDRLIGQVPAQLAAINAGLQPGLEKANARLAAASADADHRLAALGSVANGDLQRDLAAHPLRGVNGGPAAASAELVSIVQSGADALEAPSPDPSSIVADPCPVGRGRCMETGKVASGEGFDTPGVHAAQPLAVNRPASQHPLIADDVQRELDQRGIHDDRTLGRVASLRNAELNVQTTAAAIDAYQATIDAGGPGAAMAEVYQKGLKQKLAGFASDASKAKADVQEALLDFSLPMPGDAPANPTAPPTTGGPSGSQPRTGTP